MKYIVEESLRNFQFWSGGKERADNCSSDELDSIEEFLEEIEPEDGWTDTAINDMFWFEFDTLAQHLGYKDEEDFDRHHDPDYIEDDELMELISPWFDELLDNKAATPNQDNIDFIVNIALNLFDYDDEMDDEDEYSAKDFINCLNFLRNKSDEELFDALFDDDRGDYETDGEIPSWEDFREEMMIRRKA